MTGEVEEQDECFIVGVIGKAGTEQRIHADWFFRGIVEPTFAEHFKNFVVVRADTMNTPGTITTQIIDKLLNAKLVIADLTYLNPNAFYEIGIRHMAGLPIIHAHQAGEAIPFDVSTFRSLEYSRAEYHLMITARADLKGLIENALKPDHQVDNPVTQTRGRARFEATATAPDKVLLSRIEGLSARMNAFEALAPNLVTARAANALGIAGNSWSVSHSQNVRAARAHNSSETFRFELEDVTEDSALTAFKNAVLEPMFGRTIHTVRTAPRQMEVDYVAGSLSDADLQQIYNAAKKLGVIAVRL